MPTLPSTNFFPVNDETYTSTLAGSIGAGATTVPVASASPYIDGDIVVLTIEPGVSGKQATFTGTKSGNSFINCTWTEGNVGVGHDGGVEVTEYDSATHYGLVTKGLRQFFDQDATPKAGVIDNAAALASNVVTTAKINDGAVTATKIDTGALFLGYAQITSNFAPGSGTLGQVTGLTASVTIPAGGRRVKITAYARDVYSATGGAVIITSIWDGTVGSGTQLNASQGGSGSANTVGFPVLAQAIVTPAAGAKTYNVGLQCSPGVPILEAGATFPAFILVELL